MSKYIIQRTNKFKKEYQKLISKKGYKEKDFRTVLEMLVDDIPLPVKYHNHLLEPKSNRNLGMSH